VCCRRTVRGQTLFLASPLLDRQGFPRNITRILLFSRLLAFSMVFVEKSSLFLQNGTKAWGM